MTFSKKSKRFVRGILGGILTVLLLPFIGVVFTLVYIGIGIDWLLMKGWEFTVDLWREMSDPGYVRIGMFSAMARGEMMRQATTCWQSGDRPKAIALWQRAARLYEPHAMFHLAQCYEAGNVVEKDLAKAYECYRLADIYHNEKAETECKRLEQFAMNRRERSRFHDTLWTKK